MSHHGRKTYSPGYIQGNHWVLCDFCGLVFRHDDVVKTWDGKVVCKDDYEIRHPQDFVRAKADNIPAKGLVRLEPEDQYMDVPHCLYPGSVPGYAYAGCAVPSVITPYIVDESVPSSTFNTNIL